PAALQARAPSIVETAKGDQLWEFEGERYTQVGMNAVAGRRPESVKLEPFRFDQMRPGCYDVDARVRDMDINGVWASVSFPSQITGFCGRVFFAIPDRQLGLACIRAWNDWLCAETDTVISLHVGSSGIHEWPPGAPTQQISATLFSQLALTACAEWLWSGYPVKHPNLKIAMSEGGIGWVAMLLDRLDSIVDRSSYGLGWDERPADVLERNFWFCTLDDPSTIDTRYRIGV